MYCASGPDADALTLPRPYAETARLPEAALLRTAIFGNDANGQRRERIVKAIATSDAHDHGALCDHLAGKFPADRVIATIAPFSAMADAAMHVMHLILTEVAKVSALPLADVVKREGVADACATLFSSVRRWKVAAIPGIRHSESANRFANAIQSQSAEDCVRSIVQYHQLAGSGARWFAIHNDVLTPRSHAATESTGYRFRLASLGRLGVQTGVIDTIPAALAGPIADDDDLDGLPNELR